jgi:hypothetical protein
MFEQLQHVPKSVCQELRVTFFPGSNTTQTLDIFSTASWDNALSITIRLWADWKEITNQFLPVRIYSFRNNFPAESLSN